MTLPDALRILWHHHTNHPRKRWFFKPTGAPPSEEVDEACNLLAISPPEEVIPDLAGIIWNAEASLREKLGSIFMTLASRMPAGSWPLADSDIRTSHRFHQNPSRDFPDEEMQICPALIIIGLCHPSGRTREKAISSSKHLVPSLSAPLLMIRVNDWVTPIRKTTASQLANCLKALGAEEKMTLVPLLARVRQGGRHEGTLQFDQWEKILGTPFDEPVWLRSWAKAKGRQRRDYFGILKTSGHAPGVSLRRSLLSSNDRMILVWPSVNSCRP